MLICIMLIQTFSWSFFCAKTQPCVLCIVGVLCGERATTALTVVGEAGVARGHIGTRSQRHHPQPQHLVVLRLRNKAKMMSGTTFRTAMVSVDLIIFDWLTSPTEKWGRR